MIHIKYCLKCGKAFDIGTNHKICPKCRGIKLKEKRDDRSINN